MAGQKLILHDVAGRTSAEASGGADVILCTFVSCCPSLIESLGGGMEEEGANGTGPSNPKPQETVH